MKEKENMSEIMSQVQAKLRAMFGNKEYLVTYLGTDDEKSIWEVLSVRRQVVL
jgi:hypothetical protein